MVVIIQSKWEFKLYKPIFVATNHRLFSSVILNGLYLHWQKLKTHVVNDNCNPEWNDEITLSVKDLSLPVKLVSDVFLFG